MMLGKTARFLLRLVRRGGGSALPGTIAFKIQPKLLTRAIESAPMGLIAVSGTAGKSTTTKAIVELLRAQGHEVFTNPSTANIRQGLYAAVLQFGSWRGRIKADVVVQVVLNHGHHLRGCTKVRKSPCRQAHACLHVGDSRPMLDTDLD